MEIGRKGRGGDADGRCFSCSSKLRRVFSPCFFFFFFFRGRGARLVAAVQSDRADRTALHGPVSFNYCGLSTSRRCPFPLATRADACRQLRRNSPVTVPIPSGADSFSRPPYGNIYHVPTLRCASFTPTSCCQSCEHRMPDFLLVLWEAHSPNVLAEGRGRTAWWWGGGGGGGPVMPAATRSRRENKNEVVH